MKEVIIVSKTRMKTGTCVGGIVLDDGSSVRLLKSNGHNQDKETELAVGQVREIKFRKPTDVTPPHIEDVRVDSIEPPNKTFPIDEMAAYLKEGLKVKIWEGGPEKLFDGKLKWKHNFSTHSSKGYISKGNIPDNSVGFWSPDKDLGFYDCDKKIKYIYLSKSTRETQIKESMPFKGLQKAVKTIPSGTLVRVSLARWWKPNGEEVEERCYLQISGWYGLSKP